MISYIKWKVVKLEYNFAIILTDSWIGYEIIINELIYSHISNNSEIELFVYHSISENWQSLFWFFDFEDRELFKELIKISWIGWKVAINILSIGKALLSSAILSDDLKMLQSIKWVGKKMAEKIVLELKDKDIIKLSSSKVENKQKNKSNLDIEVKNNIIATLTAMWYVSSDIENALDLMPENITKIDDIIPYLIRNI